MADILNNAVTGLLSYQRALATVGHNIANATTPGYSRQQVVLGARPPYGAGGIGNGVEVTQVRRHYDQFVTAQLRDTTSLHRQLETFHAQAGLLDDVLADPEGGITPALQAFFSAVQEVADDPASTPARVALLDQGEALSARFHYLEGRMADQAAFANTQIGDLVSEINALAQSLSEVNIDILGARAGAGSSTPPDLLDRRDQLLQDLAQRIGVSAVENADGTMNVFVGSGQTLVSNDTAATLGVVRDPADAAQVRIVYAGVTGATDLTAQLSGGELGGTLQYARGLLGEARNSLGRVALTLAQTFNRQHRDGMDLDGNLGTDFFATGTPQVLANANNTGAATATAAIVDETQLTVQDYTLSFDGALFTLRSQDGASSITGAGPALGLDGFTVTLAGAAAAGDRFVIRPTRTGAASFAVAINDGNDVAAAAPVTTSAALGNGGSATVSAGEVLDVTDPNLLAGVRIRFNSASDYDLLDAGTGAVLLAGQAYTSGADIDFNGWRVQVAGTPQAGDSFSVQSNAGGISDNRNALSLGDLQRVRILEGGTATYQEAYSELVGEVGAQTRQARINADAQQSLFASVQARRESVAGVNLDEEAADLMRYQQAYQAAARVISTADSLFDTLINSF